MHVWMYVCIHVYICIYSCSKYIHKYICLYYYLYDSVSKVTGITATMLRNEKPLSEVLPLLLQWIQSTTEYVSDCTDTVHYPGMQLLQIIINVIIILHLHFLVVLVAHNGFSFNFPLMLAEVERRPKQLALCVFEDQNIHFSDTLPLLRKVCIHQLLQHKMIFLIVLNEEGW